MSTLLQPDDEALGPRRGQGQCGPRRPSKPQRRTAPSREDLHILMILFLTLDLLLRRVSERGKMRAKMS